MPSCFTKRILDIWTMTDNVSGKWRVGGQGATGGDGVGRGGSLVGGCTYRV